MQGDRAYTKDPDTNSREPDLYLGLGCVLEECTDVEDRTVVWAVLCFVLFFQGLSSKDLQG